MRFGFGFSEICKQSGQITEHLQNNASSERFFNWIPKVQKCVNLVDLVKSVQTSMDLLAKIGVDTAENEPSEISNVAVVRQ